MDVITELYRTQYTVNNSSNEIETPWPFDFIFTMADVSRRYIFGVVEIIGIFGNCLSIVVFTRCRRQDLVTVTYLTPLAVADLLTLLGGAHTWIVSGIMGKGWGYFFIEPPESWSAQIVCKCVRYVYGISSCLSSYLIVMFSLERCLGVWTPMRLHVIVTTARRKYAIMGLIVICFLVNIPVVRYYWVFNYHGTGVYSCFFLIPEFTPYGRYLLVGVMSQFFPLAIPCAFVLVNSIVIVCGLRKAQMEAETLTGKASRDRNSLVTLLLVAVLYLITILPYLIVFGYLDYYNYVVGSFPGLTSRQVKALLSLGNISRSFSMMNYSFNFLIYACTLKVYKDEIRAIKKNVMKALGFRKLT